MKFARSFASISTAIAALLAGRSAMAQEPLPPGEPVVVQQAPPATTTVVVAAPPAEGERVVVVERDPSSFSNGRFRFGIELGGGYMFAGGELGSARGGAFNTDIRLGWQLNDFWAVYYQGGLGIGVAGGYTSDRTVIGGAAVSFNNSILGEYTLGHILHLGVGPSLDRLFGGVCESDTRSGETRRCLTTGSLAFGFDARIAATFGSVRPGRRKSFSIGIDLHPTFTSGTTYFFTTLNLGYEMH